MKNIFKASKDGLVFYEHSNKLILAHVETIQARDVDEDIKKQFITQRNSYYSQNLKRNHNRTVSRQNSRRDPRQQKGDMKVK